MSKLQEIKDQVSREHGYKSFEHYDDSGTFHYDHDTPEIIDEIARRYAKAVADDALKRAAENAGLIDPSMNIRCKSGHGFEVDKQSILSTPINTDL